MTVAVAMSKRCPRHLTALEQRFSNYHYKKRTLIKRNLDLRRSLGKHPIPYKKHKAVVSLPTLP